MAYLKRWRFMFLKTRRDVIFEQTQNETRKILSFFRKSSWNLRPHRASFASPLRCLIKRWWSKSGRVLLCFMFNYSPTSFLFLVSSVFIGSISCSKHVRRFLCKRRLCDEGRWSFPIQTFPTVPCGTTRHKNRFANLKFLLETIQNPFFFESLIRSPCKVLFVQNSFENKRKSISQLFVVVRLHHHYRRRHRQVALIAKVNWLQHWMNYAKKKSELDALTRSRWWEIYCWCWWVFSSDSQVMMARALHLICYQREQRWNKKQTKAQRLNETQIMEI